MTVQLVDDLLLKASINHIWYRWLKVNGSRRAKLSVVENPTAHLTPNPGANQEMMENLPMQEHLDTRLSIQSPLTGRSRLNKA